MRRRSSRPAWVPVLRRSVARCIAPGTRAPPVAPDLRAHAKQSISPFAEARLGKGGAPPPRRFAGGGAGQTDFTKRHPAARYDSLSSRTRISTIVSHTFSLPRHEWRPRLAATSPSFEIEGAGKAGRRSHPRSCAQKAHEWTTGSTGSFRLSPRDWFTAYSALSPVTGFVATVALRITDASRTGWWDASPHGLTPASGRQDHTTSPSAPAPPEDPAAPRAARRIPATTVGSAVRPRAFRSLTASRPAIPCAPDAVASIASHRAFVTSRDPPLCRVGWGEDVVVICPTG